jgi:hypothetical protein
VQRVDQLLLLAAGAPRHQRHLAPAHRVVGERHRAGRAHLRQGDPAHPVAQLDRQVERHVEARRVALEGGLGPAEHPLDAVGVGPDGGELPPAAARRPPAAAR